jgi:probable phosphoglycerate mutase
MELIFIRHGEPQWSIDGISQVDPGLTPRGHDQSRLAAHSLTTRSRQLTEIIVSPLRRAAETAAPLCDATGLSCRTVDGLTEIGMPDWSTTPEADVQSSFREAQARHPKDWWAGMPGGEPFDDFHKRVAAAITDIVAARGAIALEGHDRHLWRTQGQPEQRIAIVAHAGTNAAALGTLLHIEPTPWEWDRFALGHGSISRVRLIPLGTEHVFSLRALNDRAHLPPDLQTR